MKPEIIIDEATNGVRYDVTIRLDIEPNVQRIAGIDVDFAPRDAYIFAKKLEDFIRKRFIGVRDFKCTKQPRENHFIMCFTHMGYSMRAKDTGFKLLEIELQTLTKH